MRNLVRALPWIGAVFFGALIPALVVTVLLADFTLFPVAFIITLGHAIVFGLPVALLYRELRWTRLSAALAGGFLIGAIPFSIFEWPIRPNPGERVWINGVITSINGIPTASGWLGYLAFVAVAGGFGAVGGLVFWLTFWSSGALKIAEPAALVPSARGRVGSDLTDGGHRNRQN
jgi:hypothetical protein